ncbi:uncharacterized protein UV8b_03409 [Ustilaginoidea virens]|uniref:SigF-like NTF2-like domain-containing protein n=1 Tax=Ustilaginoidea virens TaxID=1159556 RepID=A0A8E5HPQ3_USTVR|nr:uncharacterized protein UV8b_03409 [Ustilaginoidea virens]QUC19168.1 hypothetical protein UV8b_03409 [Ustilaginoidea virens]
MEHPVREIPSVIAALSTGSPQQQRDTLAQYFLPDVSFTHPFCHVPAFHAGAIPFAPRLNSRWLLLCIYRWYRTLSPSIDIAVDSAVFDQRSSLLYVNIHQTFRVFFVPLYAARVRLVTVLRLQQRTAWPAAETVSRAGLTEAREPATTSPRRRTTTSWATARSSCCPGWGPASGACGSC